MLFLTQQEKKCLQLFKDQVIQKVGDSSIQFMIFGSRVKGHSNEASDIDVLVLVSQKNTSIKNMIWDIAAEIQMDHEIEIAPLVMTAKEYKDLLRRERLLALDIQRDGVAL